MDKEAPTTLHTPTDRRRSSQPTPRPSKQLRSETDTPKGEAAPTQGENN
jgi:hypothetical protein